jgi:hypothetical protein
MSSTEPGIPPGTPSGAGPSPAVDDPTDDAAGDDPTGRGPSAEPFRLSYAASTDVGQYR